MGSGGLLLLIFEVEFEDDGVIVTSGVTFCVVLLLLSNSADNFRTMLLVLAAGLGAGRPPIDVDPGEAVDEVFVVRSAKKIGLESCFLLSKVTNMRTN